MKQDQEQVLAPPEGGRRLVDMETGEVIVFAAPAELEAPAIPAAALMRYARNKTKLDALRLQLADRAAALVAADEEATRLSAELRAVEVEVATMDAGLEAAFTHAQRAAQTEALSIEAGFIRVTWGAPPMRWTKRMSDEMIAREHPEIAEIIGLRQVAGQPPSPRVTIRAEKLPVMR